jgi:hypothetical protein
VAAYFAPQVLGRGDVASAASAGAGKSFGKVKSIDDWLSLGGSREPATMALFIRVAVEQCGDERSVAELCSDPMKHFDLVARGVPVEKPAMSKLYKLIFAGLQKGGPGAIYPTAELTTG